MEIAGSADCRNNMGCVPNTVCAYTLHYSLYHLVDEFYNGQIISDGTQNYPETVTQSIANDISDMSCDAASFIRI